MRPSGDGVSRVLVFGAGEGGIQTITAMLRNPNSPYLPVAMLDDDPAKRNLRLRGVRVVGGRDALARAATDYDATTRRHGHAGRQLRAAARAVRPGQPTPTSTSSCCRRSPSCSADPSASATSAR